MLTKNFYSYIKVGLQKAEAIFTKTDSTTIQMSHIDAAGYPPLVAMRNWSWSKNQHGVSFGTGTTPPTASDYFLENILTSTSISVATPSAVSFSRVDTYEEYSVTFGVTNKTDNAITITEVGLIAALQSSGSYALVDRTVLETPITIPAGQSKQITYTIRFNYGA